MAIPNEEQREMAVELKKMGVDLIIGSHPHVMQGHEWLNDTLVHYSLGNFVFHPHYTFMGVSLSCIYVFFTKMKTKFIYGN